MTESNNPEKHFASDCGGKIFKETLVKFPVESCETLEKTSEHGGPDSTTVTNSQTRLSSEDTNSFTSKLKQLPVATVREKLNFPLKFEKMEFCLDFLSARSSGTSDCEPTSLR